MLEFPEMMGVDTRSERPELNSSRRCLQSRLQELGDLGSLSGLIILIDPFVPSVSISRQPGSSTVLSKSHNKYVQRTQI